MWDKKQTKLFIAPTLSRKFILKPHLLKILGNLKGRHILELGCGSGYWTRILRDHGAICTGIDASSEQIELARSLGTENIIYLKDGAEKFNTKKKFDIIFIDHIISETASYNKIFSILWRARALLKRKGFIVLNEMHPSVAHFPFVNIQTNRGYFYFKSGSPFVFQCKQTNDKYFRIKDYHWTLQDFSEFLHSAGFIINQIIEPRATKKTGLLDNYLKLRYLYPSHLLIKASPDRLA